MTNLDAIAKIVKTMIEIDEMLCPSCDRYDECLGTDMECLETTALKAKKMRKVEK